MSPAHLASYPNIIVMIMMIAVMSVMIVMMAVVTVMIVMMAVVTLMIVMRVGTWEMAPWASGTACPRLAMWHLK